jgi:fido (protein-threonine AMPylation protein)
MDRQQRLAAVLKGTGTMATPNKKLAASLTILRKLQTGGRRVFQSQELGRVHRERLLENGFLQDVMKGWLISSGPGARDGDSTPWYASFWEFCARYCAERFGEAWYLAPEQSLLLHAENTVIPAQVIVSSPKGMNNKIALLFGTSLYDLKQPQMPTAADLMLLRDGLRVFTPAAAIIRAPEGFFASNPIETRVVLASFRDASDLLRRLLDGGHTVVAGRLAGALRHIGRPEAANEVVTTMKAAGYDVRESNPFADRAPVAAATAAAAPIVGRMQAMWESMRGKVLDIFPPPPGLPEDRAAFLQFVDDIYRSDAYHSLSIEGFSVSEALVERVRAGNWDPAHHDDDRHSRDALAARGYWQAFQAVKASIGEIISGANPGRLARASHRDWYRELFQPCVSAGLITPSALAGYRNDAVYLRTSRYVPPRWEAVRDAMPALFDLLEHETEPGVRAVLGHWLFGYVHPYPDGNGRMARFLMNAMLASGGYPWTVVRVEDRNAYLDALDRASIDMDIAPFADFIAERVKWSKQQAA